jgi:hypothetical protein
LTPLYEATPRAFLAGMAIVGLATGWAVGGPVAAVGSGAFYLIIAGQVVRVLER